MRFISGFSWYVIAAAVLVGGVYAAFLKSCGSKEMREVVQITSHENDSARYYRDLWGAEHVSRLLAEGDRRVIAALYKGRMDSVCRRLGLKEKQLQDMASVVARDSGGFVAPVRRDSLMVHDTLRDGLSFHWADDYINVGGFVDTGSAYVTYNIVVPISISTYWKRRWLLGRKRYFIDGYSDNPYVHLSGISGIKIN